MSGPLFLFLIEMYNKFPFFSLIKVKSVLLGCEVAGNGLFQLLDLFPGFELVSS